MTGWRIVLWRPAREALAAVDDVRVRRKLAERIDALAQDPDKQGKALLGELAGLRSVRAVGQRWRIIYKVEHGHVLVLVLALGLRKDRDKRDIYALARCLVKLHLTE